MYFTDTHHTIFQQQHKLRIYLNSQTYCIYISGECLLKVYRANKNWYKSFAVLLVFFWKPSSSLMTDYFVVFGRRSSPYSIYQSELSKRSISAPRNLFQPFRLKSSAYRTGMTYRTKPTLSEISLHGYLFNRQKEGYIIEWCRNKRWSSFKSHEDVICQP